MIALDTNALVRILVEDDAKQAQAVRDIIVDCEAHSRHIMILAEVLIETVWFLNPHMAVPGMKYTISLKP